MDQRRLSVLSLLSTESELVKELHIDNLVDESEVKSKKEASCLK